MVYNILDIVFGDAVLCYARKKSNIFETQE